MADLAALVNASEYLESSAPNSNQGVDRGDYDSEDDELQPVMPAPSQAAPSSSNPQQSQDSSSSHGASNTFKPQQQRLSAGTACYNCFKTKVKCEQKKGEKCLRCAKLGLTCEPQEKKSRQYNKKQAGQKGKTTSAGVKRAAESALARDDGSNNAKRQRSTSKEQQQHPSPALQQQQQFDELPPIDPVDDRPQLAGGSSSSSASAASNASSSASFQFGVPSIPRGPTALSSPAPRGQQRLLFASAATATVSTGNSGAFAPFLAPNLQSDLALLVDNMQNLSNLLSGDQQMRQELLWLRQENNRLQADNKRLASSVAFLETQNNGMRQELHHFKASFPPRLDLSDNNGGASGAPPMDFMPPNAHGNQMMPGLNSSSQGSSSGADSRSSFGEDDLTQPFAPIHG